MKESKFRRGLKEGSKIAWLSFLTLLGIGVVEILAGVFSGSVSATADGLDSMSDAAISLVVFLGLKFSQKKPDDVFHFGYHKIETLAALAAAVGMVVVGVFIAQHSVVSLFQPAKVGSPVLVMVVLGSAACLSWYRAFQMQKIANKYNLLSLKTDAKNSIKDGSASLVGLVSVAVASFFGFQQMDAIGGIIISGYIFTVAYVTLKSSSLILVDANYNKTLAGAIRRRVESRFGLKVTQILLRPTGPFFHCEIRVKVPGSMSVRRMDNLRRSISEYVNKESEDVNHVTVLPSLKAN